MKATTAPPTPVPATPEADLVAHQHVHNALAVALWHVARGDFPAAMARIRRAQSRLKSMMEVAQ